jgi:flagellar protein FliO/FliZ
LYPFWRRTGLISVLLLTLLVSVPASIAAPSAGAGFERDKTPLSAKLTGADTGKEGGSSADPVSSGSTLRMLVGLAIVLVLIYGIYRVMKRSSNKGEPQPLQGDDWMTVLASTPLAQSRSIHLVRVGDEVVLVGTGEQGVTPIRVYTAEEARRLHIEPPAPLTPAFTAHRTGDEPNPGFFEALVESIKKKTAR